MSEKSKPTPVQQSILTAEKASRTGNYSKAVDILSNIIKENKSQIDSESLFVCYLNRGFALRKIGKQSAALEDYEKASSLNPKDFKPYLNAGLILAQDYSKYKEGLAEFEKAFQLNPMSTDVLSSLALTKGFLGDLKGAEEDLVAALSIEPNNADFLCNLGTVYLKTKQPVKAVEMYRKALTIDDADDIRASLDLALNQIAPRAAVNFQTKVTVRKFPASDKMIKPVIHDQLIALVIFSGLTALAFFFGNTALLVYVIVSSFLAFVIKPGLKKLDGPPVDDNSYNEIAFGPKPYSERENELRDIEMRKMLSGSIPLALFLIVVWVGPILFFTGKSPVSWKVAIAFAVVSGFGLSIAWYNIVKVWLLRKLKSNNR